VVSSKTEISSEVIKL